MVLRRAQNAKDGAVKQVIVIAGPPAVGKKTLAWRIKNEPAVAESLDIRSPVSLYGINLREGTGTPITDKSFPDPIAREQALRSQVLAACEDNVVLVWQHPLHYLVDALIDLHPDALHVAYLLWIPIEENLRRIREDRKCIAKNWNNAVLENYAKDRPVDEEMLKMYWNRELMGRFQESVKRSSGRLKLRYVRLTSLSSAKFAPAEIEPTEFLCNNASETE